MATMLRTVEEIKAEVELLKAMKQLRADAAAVVANGDVDEAAKRLFLVHYGRPYDLNDSEDRWELEHCRSLVHNPLLLYDRQVDGFAKIVAELAAPGPEKDARLAERAIRDGLASRNVSGSHVLRAVHGIGKNETDPWAEFDDERWELGLDEHFQPDPEDCEELAAMERGPGRPVDDGFGWEEQEACRVKGGVR